VLWASYDSLVVSEMVGLSGRGMASNVALLTQSHKAVKAKKRQKLGQASAVVFDEDARRCAYSPFSLCEIHDTAL
jgi:hypothetical protein